MKYRIVRSGSRGNCVIVDDMMFDCGVSFKEIKEDLYKVKYLFITHRHSDHINKNTLKRIVKKYPRIEIVGNYDVMSLVKLDTLVGDETRVEKADRLIQAFECLHDVPCTGYVIEKDGKSLIYATDTASLEYAPKIKYDYFFIESNHDEKKIKEIMGDSKKYGYNARQGAMRHLSKQKSELFYYLNRKDKDSLYVELHKSERFY